MRLISNSFLVTVLVASPTTRLSAAPGDQLVGEQSYDMLGVPATLGSFWDPAFWRDTTAPLESPIVPGPDNVLSFRSKDSLGAPMAAPATGMTLKTGKALGFTPPVVPPALARVFFQDNVLRFDGTPDELADPLGRLTLADPHPLQLEGSSSIDFDRTVVQTNNMLIFARSGIQITGDVTANGHASNFTNPATGSIERTGAGAVSPLLVRQNGIATLGTAVYTYSLHPTDPNTGNAPVFRVESGGKLVLTTGVLNSPTGVVFDAEATTAASSILLDSVSSSGALAGADPVTLFRADGAIALPATPTLRVTGDSQFTDMTGTFARATNGATINFDGEVAFPNVNNLFRVEAFSGGRVGFERIESYRFSSLGTIQVDWVADTGGVIDGGMPTSGFLHLNNGPQSLVASSGGEIRMIPNMGIDPLGTLSMQALGSNSLLSFPNPCAIEAWDDGDPFTPEGNFHSYTIEARNGASIVGGSLVTSGLFVYPDLCSLSATGNTNNSSLTVENSSVSYLGVYLGDHVEVSIGGAPSGSTLRHFDCNMGSDSKFTVTGGTWRPESPATLGYRQSLAAGGQTGRSTILMTGATIAHEVDVNVGAGDGSFEEPGAPASITLCTFTENAGSTWTGALDAATNSSGRAAVQISGAGTTAGLRYVNLGAWASPQSNSGPGMSEFNGSFDLNRGGEADLTLSLGARMSVGCYTSAFGDWRRPDMFSPSWIVLNDSEVNIDATSAIYLGDAASAAAVDYRNGAMVVGPGCYLLGTGTIRGMGAGGTDLVVAGGWVAPGFFPGRISVDGNFRVESGTLVLEVESGGASGCDQFSAAQIAVLAGTIRIVPGVGFVPGSTFTVDLFDTANLSIGPGVIIEIDPVFSGSSFDPLTGLFTVVASGSGGGDANGNGIADIIEEVLPAQGSGVEWPTLTRNQAGGSVYRFRRLDSSENTRGLTVQWSTNLLGWTDIPVGAASAPPVVHIEENTAAPDLIEVTLPDSSGANRFFVRLCVE